jgi:hypothetical protein
MGNQLSAEGKYGNFAEPASAVMDSCRPGISGKHFSIYCLDETPAAELTAPETSGAVKSLVYEERFIDLGCRNKGFTGYFSPSEWTVSKIYGDGGVDVTGAPNALSVEGAGNAMVNVLSGGRTRMQIPVPTNGMIAFDWRNVGGSNLFSDEFRVLVNDRAFSPIRHTQAGGRFRCPVRSGDQLILEFTPRHSTAIQIDQFRLLGSATAVIQRRWTATDEKGHSNEFTQFISIEQPNISDIIFPPSTHITPDPQAADPSITGYPYIDRDGDPATTGDRHFLVGNSCQFDVDYTDDLQQTPQGIFLYRHWIVSDECGGNTMEETQIIRLISDPASGRHPEDSLYQWLKEEPHDQLASPELSTDRNQESPHTKQFMTF